MAVSHFRYVDCDLIVKEHFISLTHLPKTTSDTIFKHLIDELERLEIPLSNCRGTVAYKCKLRPIVFVVLIIIILYL